MKREESMENLRGAAEQNRSSRPLARQRHGDEGGGTEGEVTPKVGVNTVKGVSAISETLILLQSS